LKSDRFLRACWREPVDATPVWFMRQAGRYLPGYREARKAHTVLEICKQPALAAEVTVEAVRTLGVDAAIVFADIMLPLEAMGVSLEIKDRTGPVIDAPLESAEDVARLRPLNPEIDTPFVLEAVHRVREKLGGAVPLIGFCGAPFTLASYLIEGGPSRDFVRTRRFMRAQPETWTALMVHLTEAMSAYLTAQVRAGAQAVQIFDSWVGCLGPRDYRAFVLPHSRRLFESLHELDVPRIHFGTNTASLLDAMREAGGDVFSVDWRIPIDEAWRRVGYDRAIQGNLDPAVLLVNRDAIEAETRDVLDRVDGREGHVFNLGHGVLPDTPVEHARAVVDLVHTLTSRG